MSPPSRAGRRSNAQRRPVSTRSPAGPVIEFEIIEGWPVVRIDLADFPLDERPARELTLDQLRKLLEVTQVELAARLEVTQPAISQLERGNDMLVSTLANYVEALGGQLEVAAVFPNHTRIALDVG